MYGLIYFLLQKFVQRKLGSEGWEQALKGAHLENETFHPNMSYPDTPIFSLIYFLAKKNKISVEALLTDFGKAIAPDLLALHPGLIKSHWKTLDVIENTGGIIHQLVRQMMKGSVPPSIQCVRLSETEVQMIYASSRKLCTLAKGICHGVAETFGERLEIEEPSCMHREDPFCLMNIKLVGGPADKVGKAWVEQKELNDTNHGLDVDSWEFHELKKFFDPPESPEEVARLGHYSIRKLIGSGGMGLVFEVMDLKNSITRALKLIKPEMLISETHRLRFLREARILAELNSPCIVPVLQVGSYRSLPYLVMPLLQGCNLETWLASPRQVTLEFLYMLGLHIGNGLREAHERRLIHRDIKPGNVWIFEDQKSAQIMDFGLVLDLNEQQRVTKVGVLMGTIHYMAPEQMCDSKLNEQADLYSMGIILYQLMTGKLPFGKLPYLVLIKKLMTEQPVPPHKENKLVPDELSAPILRLLESDIQARTRDASAFILEWKESFRQLSSRDPDWASRVVFTGPFYLHEEEKTTQWTSDEMTGGQNP